LCQMRGQCWTASDVRYVSSAMVSADLFPERLVRFCGADCSRCDKYRRFLAGDESGLVNPENQYRCCWLPRSYPKGIDCPIRVCCDEKGVYFCGECDQFEGCVTIEAFYSQPGYHALRERMLDEVEKRKVDAQDG
jgi:hypothetical protein